MTPDTHPPDTYPIELTAPDIRPYRDGTTGIPYYTTIDSGRPGPHVLINALVHGNELCGAIAAVFLLDQGITPLLGRLTVGFSNVEAYARFDTEAPSASRFVDEDFNRVWDPETLDGPRRSIELDRAREIRPLIDTVDLMLDIHSMQHATRPLMMAGALDKGLALARAIGTPKDIVRDHGHAAGRRLRDYAGFGDPNRPQNALLIECGQHWEREAAPIAIDSALRFLIHSGLIEQETVAAHLRPLPVQQAQITVTEAVTIRTDRFRFADRFIGMEVLERAGTPIGYDGEEPVVTPYDNCVLIMPTRRIAVGNTAVRLGRLEA